MRDPVDPPTEGGSDPVRLLSAGTVTVISEAELQAKLAQRRPLRVKLGIDPTASEIHLGFAVVLRKLRQFQDLGHTGVLILGDFTAQIGDPSGRSAGRPAVSTQQVEKHLVTYEAQAKVILHPDRLEVRRNSEWLSILGVEGILQLASAGTVAQMLERDDFQRRLSAGQPISLIELLYPLLQGWDSVMVRSDVELGGSDQLFNMLVGRELQAKASQERQVVITTPLLEGLDGVQKMSKSLNNYVGIMEPPGAQFGKLMSISDALLPRYLALATGWDPVKVEAEVARIVTGTTRPDVAKRLLARTVVDLYHGAGAGAAAEAEFNRVFKGKKAPDHVATFLLQPEHLIDGRIRLARLLALAGLVRSNSEGQRKIAEGAVRVDGERLSNHEVEFSAEELNGKLVQVGKRAWVRIHWGGN